MRSPTPLLPLALIAVVGLGACGSADQRSGSHVASHTARKTANADSYMNDGDKDMVGDADGDEGYKVSDLDKDSRLDEVPLDYQVQENSRYHDADDHGALIAGRPASATQQRAVTTVVERYYAAATAGDGARACDRLTTRLARAVPIDYGKHGPPYVRSAKTCATVLSLLFAYEHRQLAAPIAVTSVRILTPSEAYALIGSPRIPASYTILENERGSWRIGQLLANENILS